VESLFKEKPVLQPTHFGPLAVHAEPVAGTPFVQVHMIGSQPDDVEVQTFTLLNWHSLPFAHLLLISSLVHNLPPLLSQIAFASK
jgi:hypothetical protein